MSIPGDHDGVGGPLGQDADDYLVVDRAGDGDLAFLADQ
jgi:hypothetical protein